MYIYIYITDPGLTSGPVLNLHAQGCHRGSHVEKPYTDPRLPSGPVLNFPTTGLLQRVPCRATLHRP